MKRWTDERGWRWYLPDGAAYPVISVTTVCGAMPHPRLSKWKESRAEKLGEALATASDPSVVREKAHKDGNKAANDGTAMHKVLEQYHTDGSIVARTEPEKVQLANYIKYIEPLDLEPIEQEVVLVHPSGGYGGTADMLANTKRGVTLCDFKTGRSTTSAGHQLGAYKMALEQTRGLVIDALLVISIPLKDTSKGVSSYYIEHIDFVEKAYLHQLQSFKAKFFPELTKWGIKDPDSPEKVYRWPVPFAVADSYEEYLILKHE